MLYVLLHTLKGFCKNKCVPDLSIILHYWLKNMISLVAWTWQYQEPESNKYRENRRQKWNKINLGFLALPKTYIPVSNRAFYLSLSWLNIFFKWSNRTAWFEQLLKNKKECFSFQDLGIMIFFYQGIMQNYFI